MKKKIIIMALSLNVLLFNTMLLTGCEDDQTNNNTNTATNDNSNQMNTLPNATVEIEEEIDNSIEDLVITEDEIIENTLDNQELIEEDYVIELVEMENFEFTNIENLENVAKGWGQGVHVDEYNRPTACDSYQEKYMEYEAYFIMPNVEGEQKMYLTFDQGYENGYTSMILDSLLEKDCPAVFFLTLPYAKGNPDLVQRMVDEGHILGNHSVSHLSTPTLSAQKQAEEILELHNYMIEEYNYEMDLFRPPMGEWSTQSLEITRQLGYKTIFWSYAYKDWEVDNQMGVDVAFPLVTGAAHNGGLYLLHSVSEDNANMLGDVIDNLRAEGYEFCELDFDKIVFATDDELEEVQDVVQEVTETETQEEEETTDVIYVINPTD